MDSTVPIYDTQVRAASPGPGAGGAGLMSCGNGRKKGHTAAYKWLLQENEYILLGIADVTLAMYGHVLTLCT